MVPALDFDGSRVDSDGGPVDSESSRVDSDGLLHWDYLSISM